VAARGKFITLPEGMRRIWEAGLKRHPRLAKLREGTPAYRKVMASLVQERAEDALHSILPADRFGGARGKRANPYTAQVKENVYAGVPLFSGPESLFVQSKLPQHEIQTMYRDFRSCVVRLANLYCEIVLGHEGDRSYDMKTDMNEADQKEIWRHRYERLLVVQMLLGALESVYSVRGIPEGLKKLGLDESAALSFLSSASTREQFLKASRADVKQIFSGVDLRKMLGV
jgi:hypothetical protein